MQEKNTKLDFSGQDIYVGLDTGGLSGNSHVPAHAGTTKDKEKRNRNDQVDARKLARNLRNGKLIPLYVPSPSVSVLEDRSQGRHKTQDTRRKDDTRSCNLES